MRVGIAAFLLSFRRLSELEDLGDDTSSNYRPCVKFDRKWKSHRLTGLIGFAESEACSDFESDVEDETADHLDVVTGHDLGNVNNKSMQESQDKYHLFSGVGGAFRESQSSGDISSTDEALGPVVLHEGSVTTSLILGENLQSRRVLVRQDLSIEEETGVRRAEPGTSLQHG